MKPSPYAVGMLIAALAALSALASPAFAVEFHSEIEHTNYHLAPQNVHHLKAGSFDVTCENATYRGTVLPKTNSSLDLPPEYSGCHVIIAPWTFTPTVNTNGCTFIFKANGDVAISCATGKKITITYFGCTIEIGSQEIKGGVAYANEGSGSGATVKVTWKATGIKYSQAGSSCGSKEGSDAVYEGASSLSGRDTSGEPVWQWWGDPGTQFHSEAEHTTFHLTQQSVHHLKTSTFDVTCEKSTLHGTGLSKTTHSLSLTPEYYGCHVIILFTFAGTVNTNGCTFTLEADEGVDIACPAGKKIAITSAGCNIEVGPQEIKAGASYANEGSGSGATVKVTWKASGIKYSQTGSSCATKEGSDAVYEGVSSLSGTNTAGAAAGQRWE